MVMNKKNIYILLVFLFVSGVLGCSRDAVHKKKPQTIEVEGIQNLKIPQTVTKGHYLLFYPRDLRFGQKKTLVQEIDLQGKKVIEYQVLDQDFRRVAFHQKPKEPNVLYGSLFGEASLNNFYYTFDLKQRKFKKINLTYFKYDVGIASISNYDSDVIFQTIVSHKTGDQNYDAGSGTFQVSISDATTQESFETEHGYVPNGGGSSILNFQDRIVYGIAGRLGESFGVAFVDMKNQLVTYHKPKSSKGDISIQYANATHMFTVDQLGTCFVYDRNFKVSKHEPFKQIVNPNVQYFFAPEGKRLMLDENKALYQVVYYKENKDLSMMQYTKMGIFHFDEIPTFEIMEAEYIVPDYDYEFLYQDLESQEIYIKKVSEKESFLLVLDAKSLKLKEEIPVDYGEKLDFVIKI